MNYRDAVSRLYSLEFAGVKLGLANITKLCAAIGNPQNEFVSVHVAGTNGKGSVCAILTSVLRSAGYRVGRFTSPHLRDFRERIQLDGRMISRDRVTEFVDAHWTTIKRGGYSFFEATTAMAFQRFAHAGVDVAIVEVGLGGRLDATSIIPASLSVITRIARDHERLLGHTPRQIAREKAGIIRRGVPVLTGPLIPEAHTVIHRVAQARGAPIWTTAEILDASHSRDLLPPASASWPIALPGGHQTGNCAIALAALQMLRGVGYTITPGHVARGLRDVHWPARFQIAGDRPLVVYDAAHNLDGVRAVVDTWRALYPARRAVVVFTARADKDVGPMAHTLAPMMDHWIGCPLPTMRGAERSELESLAGQAGVPFSWAASPRAAARLARRIAGVQGAVLVIGSHFLIGDIIRAEEITNGHRRAVSLWPLTQDALLAAAREPGTPF
ncbi:MAG TPA: folylpolyglutamate synthase/dihydrofolate synthase family protein [candidate division Zixibacteria bacterium]|nr:folylpolyglutamate synthase/dihydrofolate synthase family protein [candidate division Zixibacteria bacterium]